MKAIINKEVFTIFFYFINLGFTRQGCVPGKEIPIPPTHPFDHVFQKCFSLNGNLNEIDIYLIYTARPVSKRINLARAKSIYFKGRNFRGQKLSRFSRFWPSFAEVYAFGNFKTAKRESFFTRNHR